MAAAAHPASPPPGWLRARLRSWAPFAAVWSRGVMLRTRSGAVAWLRIGVGAWMALVLVSMQTATSHYAAEGLELMQGVAIGVLFAIGFAVLAATAGSVSEEKEQRTLGLLRMTGLSPWGILLAAILGRLAEVVLLLAVTLPLALVAVALGGVAAQQVFALYIALAAWLALLAAIGAFWSVVVRSANLALGLGVATTFAWFLVLMVADRAGHDSWFSATTVLYRFQEILDTSSASPDLVGTADVVQVAEAAAIVALARLCFPRGDGEIAVAAAAPAAPPRAARWPLRLLARLRAPLVWTRPRPGAAALRWKEFHHACGGVRGLVLNLLLPWLLYAGYALVMAEGRQWPRDPSLGVLVCAALVVVVRAGLWLGGAIAGELRQNTWDDLRTLPLGLPGILRGKLLAAALALLPALASCGLAWAGLPRDAFGEVHPLRAIFGLETPAAMACAAASMAIAFWALCLYLALAVPRHLMVIALSTAAAILLLYWNLDAVVNGFTWDQDTALWATAAGLVATVVLAVLSVGRLRHLDA
jgi:ABC-type transport system involved in multi-copper enzyme maturation permease subunit